MRSVSGRVSLVLASVVWLATPALGKPAKKVTPPPPPPSTPDASFDELLDEAEPVTDLGQLIEPLFDTCDSADPLERRRCDGSRGFLESQARSKTYVMTADAAASPLGAADPKDGSMRLDVLGCLDCLRPVRTDDGHGKGVARLVTVYVPKAIQNGHASGVELDSTDIGPFRASDAQAKWKQSQKRLRAQFIFRFGSTFSSGGMSGVTIDALAYRVVDPCSGRVYLISPRLPEGHAPELVKQVTLSPSDALVCPKPEDDITPEQRADQEELARRPEQLSLDAIERAFASVRVRVRECGAEFELSGLVNLVVTVAGPTGRVTEVKVEAPFDKTAAGLCVKAAVKDASFARFQNATQEIKIPVALR